MTAISNRVLSHRKSTVAITVIVVAMVLLILGANPAVSQSQVLTAHRVSAGQTLDPSASEWSEAPAIDIAMTSQQVTWPFGGSVSNVEARALHSEGVLYLRMSWEDMTRDDTATHVDEFTDAAAVEFPAQAASSVPSICMGQTDGGVNIWQWRAAGESGLPDSIEDLTETGYVDRYPSTDSLQFPAREAGNPVALSHPVQNLVSVGFGTLSPAGDQDVRGSSEWDGGRWSVVFARELSDSAVEQFDLGEGASVDIAFAVWDGSNQERNGVKSVSQFVVLDVIGGGAPRSTTSWLTVVVGTALGVMAVVLLPAFIIDHSVNKRSRSKDMDTAAEPT